MPASYVSEADVDALIGPREREAMLLDEDGDYDAGQFARLAEYASELLRSAARRGTGTDPGVSTVDTLLVAATAAYVARLIYMRAQKDPPPDLQMIFDTAWEGIASGALPLPEVPSDPYLGRGGVGSRDAKPRVFANLRRLV
jgi:hypothetical protein